MAIHSITITAEREAILTALNAERDRLGGLNQLTDENDNPVDYVPMSNTELLQTLVNAALDLRISQA